MNQNNDPNSRWQPVTNFSNNQRWEPQKNPNFNDANPGRIVGYYTNTAERDGGVNGMFTVSTIHFLNQDGSLGEEFDVACANALSTVPMFSCVCLSYHGKKASKKPGRTFNDWKVMVDTQARPYNTYPEATARPAATAKPQNQAPAQEPQFNPSAQNSAPQGFNQPPTQFQQQPNQQQQPNAQQPVQNQQFQPAPQQFVPQGQPLPSAQQTLQQKPFNMPDQNQQFQPVQQSNNGAFPTQNPFPDNLPF